MHTDDEIAAWLRGAKHYAKLAGAHTDASSRLACLVLASWCAYVESGDHGGPSLEMVELSESLLGVSLNKVIDW